MDYQCDLKGFTITPEDERAIEVIVHRTLELKELMNSPAISTILN